MESRDLTVPARIDPARTAAVACPTARRESVAVMAAIGNLHRRRLLSLLAGVLAAPAATARLPARAPDAAERLVTFDGWILRASDLEKVALHAA